MDRELLRELVDRFKREFVPTGEYPKHQTEHDDRHARAAELLTPARIPSLTEEEIRLLFHDSDAFGFWRSPEREFQRRLQKHGLDGLRRALGRLIEAGERGVTADDLASIWQMQGIGVLLSTELLAYRLPDRYWTYSENVTLPALAVLGDDVRAELPWGQKANQHVYLALAPRVGTVREALGTAGFRADNLLVDLLLWWVKDQYAAKLEQLTFDRAAVEGGMRTFDAELRASEQWSGWEQDGRHRYALRVEDRRYPVKEVVRLATGKTEFTSAQVRPKLQKLGFEVVEIHPDARQTWIFQARPDRYDLTRTLREYRQDWFVVGAHRAALKSGDRVLLWQSGERRGIYGVGAIVSSPYETADGEMAVDVQYQGRLDAPVLADRLRQEPRLANLNVLRMPRGT